MSIQLISLPQGKTIRGKSHNYIIQKVLGQGSFGITYLAKYKQNIQGEIGRGNAWVQVCIKEFFMKDLNSRDASTSCLNDTSEVSLVTKYRKAFIREANNLSKMNHPGIVNVFEVIEANNTVYIVMEYIDGGSLDDYIKQKGCLSEIEALQYFSQICEAIDYMHSKKMLHLDLKPKNIMRDEEGHLYLIDFGLSKQYDKNGEPESSTTIGLGTSGYAPLEQAKHQYEDKTFHATIDVYALGATLFKMLTGNTPPDATDVSNSMLEGEHIIKDRLLKANVSYRIAVGVSQAMWPSSKKRTPNVYSLLNNINSNYSEETLIEHNADILSKKEQLTPDLIKVESVHPIQNEPIELAPIYQNKAKWKYYGIVLFVLVIFAVTLVAFFVNETESKQEINDNQPSKESAEINKPENVILDKKDNHKIESTQNIGENDNITMSDEELFHNAKSIADYKYLAGKGYKRAFYPLAKLYFKNRQYKEAREWGQKCIKQNVDTSDAQNLLNKIEVTECSEAIKTKDWTSIKYFADKGYTSTYAPLAKHYLESKQYNLADFYAQEALGSGTNLNEAKKVIEMLDLLGYYDNKTKPQILK